MPGGSEASFIPEPEPRTHAGKEMDVFGVGFNGAFNLQANLIIQGLRENGIKAEYVNSMKYAYSSVESLYYPFFSSILFKQRLPIRENMAIWEVGDTDRVRPDVIDYLNSYDYRYFASQSHYSSNTAYRNIKAEKKIIPCMIPHFDAPMQHRYDLFVNAAHSGERKGLDITLMTLDRLWDEGFRFRALMKSIGKPDYRREYIDLRTGFVSYEDQMRMMAECDIFFYPVRGGGFEVPILEALAIGMTVAIPDMGSWVDIPLKKDDVYWIKTNGATYEWPYGDMIHCGNMIDVDAESAYEVAKYALENRKSVNGKPYFEHYAPARVTKMFL